jgi:biotin transport system substrate-specific component
MKLTAKEIMITALFTALMTAGAFIRIPFPLLPVTLQTLICALAGLVLGRRLGALSMIVYTLLGLAGLPVFASGGGITYVFNRSFGFILGFIAGAYVIGSISEKQKAPNVINNIKSLIPGLVVIYVIGMLYMLLILRVYTGNEQAGLIFVLTANLPYIIKDLILFVLTAFIGASLLPSVRKAISSKAS